MSNAKPSNRKEYGVAFSTDEVKKSGYVTYTKITIETDVLGMDESVDIALREHPLYNDLEKYVHANPSGKPIK